MIHPTADVEDGAEIGLGTRIWRWTCVREGAIIGAGCNIGQCVYIDRGVTLGEGCKIQNGCNVYLGVHLGCFVFVGPSVTFTNVRKPRAAKPLHARARTVVNDHVTIGANATIVCGVTIGTGAFIGAGAVVTKDVAPGRMVVGSPARDVGPAPEKASAS